MNRFFCSPYFAVRPHFLMAALFLVTFVSGSFFPVVASAATYEGGGRFSKGESSDNPTWTLAGWMNQKQEFRMMDQWLAMNRSIDNFEFNIGGGHQTYDVTIDDETEGAELEFYDLSMYWSIFGLSYRFENGDENFRRDSAQVNLRLFGTSSQSTNLTAFYGLRQWIDENNDNELQNQYAGGQLTLYFFSFIGAEGEYRKYFRNEDDEDTQVKGYRVDYGAFLEIFSLRFYARSFIEETEKNPEDDPDNTEDRRGSEVGVRIHF